MTKLLALPECDPTLTEPAILSKFAIVPTMARKIEPVGKYYAELQYKVEHGAHSFEERNSSQKRKEESDDEKEEASKNKPKRTKAEIEKEAKDDNMYTLLGLEEFTYEATTK